MLTEDKVIAAAEAIGRGIAKAIVWGPPIAVVACIFYAAISAMLN